MKILDLLAVKSLDSWDVIFAEEPSCTLMAGAAKKWVAAVPDLSQLKHRYHDSPQALLHS